MRHDQPKIMVLGDHTGNTPPEGAIWRPCRRLPPAGEILEQEWDYCCLCLDTEILDDRVFIFAAEYAARYRPDMLALSSPEWRYPGGVYRGRERCFQALAEMAEAGLLYAFGNKLFSRALFSRGHGSYSPGFLNLLYQHVSVIAVLSHPWVSAKQISLPDDDGFFAMLDSFCADGQEP